MDDGLGVLAFLAKNELLNETVEVVLKFVGVVSTIDDPAVVGGFGVGLSAEFKAEIFNEVCKARPLVFQRN